MASTDRRPRLLAAPDKFRGTATAPEVALAACRAAEEAGWAWDAVPLADGGEGTLDALGGPNRRTVVHDPLGRPAEAEWRLDGRTAVIEMARASGLDLVGGPRGNDPLGASTAGTGELIAAAVRAGARRVLIGVGGSATTDGGLGCVQVLTTSVRVEGVRMVVACDVDTTFADAADVFAPQKGARPAQVGLLRRRLERLAIDYRQRFGVDVSRLPGAGAAGGLAGGLAALGAELVPGFDLVAESVELDEKVAGADLVVTGEGFVDEQSFCGKVVGGVIALCAEAGVDTLVVAGQLLVDPGVPAVALVDRFGERRARNDTPGCVTEAVAGALAARAGRAVSSPGS